MSVKAVRRNTLWNIFGQIVPLAVAVVFIPRLITGIGIERFGALTLIWTFLNYFGLFDLGIGRALTQLLAGRIDENKKEEASLIWTVSALLALLGAVAALIVFLVAPLMASRLLRLQGSLQVEATLALRELGLALPFLIHSLALKGILEARRRFDLSNLIRIPLGVFSYGAPLLVLPFSHNLGIVVAVMLMGRVLAWAVNVWMILHIMPHLAKMAGWEPGRILKLMRLGGWFTVSSVVGPMIESMDRLFINAILSISMVAYYTTPFEVISKFFFIPFSIGGAMFPEFAMRFNRDPREAQALYMRGIKYMFLLVFPAMLIITAYAHEGLSLWLNPHFADMSGSVLRWLALFFLIGSLSHVFYAFFHGIGRPDIPAYLLLLQLVIHAAVLYLLLKLYGIRGAAIAAVIRVTLEFLSLHFLSGGFLRFGARTYGKILLPLGGMIAILLGFHIPFAPLPKAILVLSTLAGYACISWTLVLEKSDKISALRLLGKA